MYESELLERLTGLESRLGRLEALLGVRVMPARARGEAGQMEADLADLVTTQPAGDQNRVDAQASSGASLELPETEDEMPLQAQRSTPPPLPPLNEVAAAIETPAVIPYSSAPPRQSARQGELEQTIGLKWAGWIGAVVLVIGAVFGIKFGYDQGWFGFVTPAVRLGFLALAGLGLIGAGEWVYRKVNVLSATGLFGAGVAVLFVVSYAGYGYFDLYGQSAAFCCMAISTVIGTLVARRGNLVSIAVLSMIGGNLAPALLKTEHPQVPGLLTYLLLLQLTSLTLAGWGANRKWWTLRGLSLATTALWTLAVINLPPRQTIELFLLVFAALYQAELIFSARRSRLSAASAGVTFSILVTAALTAALLWLLRDASTTPRLLIVLGLAAGNGIACGWLLPMRKRESAALGALSVGYAMQSLALVVVAAPIAFSGIWIAAAWSVLALLLAVAGYILDLPAPRFSAVAVWILAVGDLALWTTGAGLDQHLHQIAFAFNGVAVPVYCLVGWALAITGYLVAAVIREGRRSPVGQPLLETAQILSAAAAGLWIAVSLAGLPMLSATLAMVALGWILLGAGRLDDRLNLRLSAGLVFIIAMLKWVMFDTLLNRFAPGWAAGNQPPLLTPNIGVALALAGSLWTFSFATRDAVGLLASWRSTLSTTTVALVVLIFAGTMEIDRVVERFISPGSMGLMQSQWKHLLWTTWWMLCSCGYLLTIHWINAGDPGRRVMMFSRLSKLPAFITVKYLLLDLLYFRFTGSPAIVPVLTGPPALAGAVVMAGLIVLYWLSAGPSADLAGRTMRRWIVGLGVASLFCLLSLGIDQAFTNVRLSSSGLFADPQYAEQVALSICWAVFALASVAAGFVWRAAPLRYFGLSLFAVVLLKVVTIDLSQVSRGYRILSFIGLGALLLGTSVLYGKVSPKLLPRKACESAPPDSQIPIQSE